MSIGNEAKGGLAVLLALVIRTTAPSYYKNVQYEVR